MSRILFTADTHFGHENIIKFCARPFADVREMDEAMIANWNAVVGPDDVVWHLGDFAYRMSPDRAEAIFRRLNGREKHLVLGNHDKVGRRLPWTSQHMIGDVVVDGQRLILCHYGMRTWPGVRRGTIHLYGHSHGNLPGTHNSLDVGVDCFDFAPVDLPTIRMRLTEHPEIDFETGRTVEDEQTSSCGI